MEILKQLDHSGFQNDNTSFILKQYFKIEYSYLFDLSKKLINFPDFKRAIPDEEGINWELALVVSSSSLPNYLIGCHRRGSIICLDLPLGLPYQGVALVWGQIDYFASDPHRLVREGVSFDAVSQLLQGYKATWVKLRDVHYNVYNYYNK